MVKLEGEIELGKLELLKKIKKEVTLNDLFELIKKQETKIKNLFKKDVNVHSNILLFFTIMIKDKKLNQQKIIDFIHECDNLTVDVLSLNKSFKDSLDTAIEILNDITIVTNDDLHKIVLESLKKNQWKDVRTFVTLVDYYELTRKQINEIFKTKKDYLKTFDDFTHK